MGTTKEIQLELAAFLDSAPAKRLKGVDPDDLRLIAEAFLRASYEELGKHPRLLDGDDVHEVVGELMPGYFGPRDPAAERAPDVLEALLAHLSESHVVPHAYEQRTKLDAASDRLAAIVRSGENPRRRVPIADEKPFVHGAPKLGRNDPCSCGSGKKYKKCHGKDA